MLKRIGIHLFGRNMHKNRLVKFTSFFQDMCPNALYRDLISRASHIDITALCTVSKVKENNCINVKVECNILTPSYGTVFYVNFKSLFFSLLYLKMIV